MIYFCRVATVTLRALNGVSQLVLMWLSAPGSVRNCSSAMSSRSATALESCGCTSTISEPADQVDVVRGKIDHHADIRHPRRKQTDARDRDGENVLARESAQFAALGYEASDSTLGTGGCRDHPLRRIGRAPLFNP
jgi:hypothetical protein